MIAIIVTIVMIFDKPKHPWYVWLLAIDALLSLSLL